MGNCFYPTTNVRAMRMAQQQQLTPITPQFAQFRPQYTAVGGGFLPTAQGGGNQLAALASKVDKLTDAVSNIHQYIGQAGTIGPTPQEWGVNYARVGGSLYKGGTVTTPTVNIPDGTGAPATFTLTWPVERLTGTRLCRVRIYLNSSGGGGSLIAEASKASVSLFINGSPIPELQNVNLMQMTNTLFGGDRFAAVGIVLPNDASLTAIITVNSTLSAGPGGTDALGSIDAGDQCNYYGGQSQTGGLGFGYG